jgi:hypothetical protein
LKHELFAERTTPDHFTQTPQPVTAKAWNMDADFTLTKGKHGKKRVQSLRPVRFQSQWPLVDRAAASRDPSYLSTNWQLVQDESDLA